MDDCRGKWISGEFKNKKTTNCSSGSSNNRDGTQSHYHLGCSRRSNCVKGTQISDHNRKKYTKTSFYSSGSKSGGGSTSKSPKDHQRTHAHQRDAFLRQSNNPDGHEVSGKAVLDGVAIKQVESSGAGFNARVRHVYHPRGFRNEGSSLPSSSNFSVKTTSEMEKSLCQGQTGNLHRHGLRNVCSSATVDMVPGASEFFPKRRASVANRLILDRRRYSKSRNAIGPSNRDTCVFQRDTTLGQSRTHPVHSLVQDAVNTVRIQSSVHGGFVASVDSLRGVGSSPCSCVPGSSNESSSVMPVSRRIIQPQQTEISHHELGAPMLSHSAQTALPFIASNSCSRQIDLYNEASSSRSICRSEDRSCVSQNFSMLRDSIQRFSMDEVMEVLMNLERMEPGEGLAQEHLCPETNLLLGSWSFQDQHRDLRMDIDNMSYEELLDLEEKMGTVSTALAEEELSACLACSYYVAGSHVANVAGCENTKKCSICQEEYILGDYLGRMLCNHQYHVVCIQQWLRQKNWCPICKTPASAS